MAKVKCKTEIHLFQVIPFLFQGIANAAAAAPNDVGALMDWFGTGTASEDIVIPGLTVHRRRGGGGGGGGATRATPRQENRTEPARDGEASRPTVRRRYAPYQREQRRSTTTTTTATSASANRGSSGGGAAGASNGTGRRTLRETRAGTPMPGASSDLAED
jgi:hypothetical protein